MAKLLLVPALLMAALSTGCRLAPPKDFIGYVDHLGFQGQHLQQYQITESQVVSPNVQLSREEDGVLRGWADGAPVELRVEGNLIKGARSGQPIELHVSREGNAVVARGMFGGSLADLAVCAPASDALAPTGKVKSFSGQTPCFAGNAVTTGKMLAKLGDATTMAMLVAIYYH